MSTQQKKYQQDISTLPATLKKLQAQQDHLIALDHRELHRGKEELELVQKAKEEFDEIFAIIEHERKHDNFSQRSLAQKISYAKKYLLDLHLQLKGFVEDSKSLLTYVFEIEEQLHDYESVKQRKKNTQLVALVKKEDALALEQSNTVLSMIDTFITYIDSASEELKTLFALPKNSLQADPQRLEELKTHIAEVLTRVEAKIHQLRRILQHIHRDLQHITVTDKKVKKHMAATLQRARHVIAQQQEKRKQLHGK